MNHMSSTTATASCAQGEDRCGTYRTYLYDDEADRSEPAAVHPLLIEALLSYEKRGPLFTEEEIEMLSPRITLTDGKSRVQMKAEELCDAIRLNPFFWDKVEGCIRVARLESQIKQNNPSDREYHAARTYYDQTVKAFAERAEANQSPVEAIVLEVASNRWEKVQRCRQEYDDYFGVSAAAA